MRPPSTLRVALERLVEAVEQSPAMMSGVQGLGMATIRNRAREARTILQESESRALHRIAERFWPKVDKTETCWIWRGSVGRDGYGRSSFRSALTSAHRISWQLVNGAIPEGMHVLHHCDNPPCVNPAHLFLGTHADNMRDMSAKGRGRYGVTPSPQEER